MSVGSWPTEHSIALLVFKVWFWGYTLEFAFLTSCSPLIYPNGQFLKGVTLYLKLDFHAGHAFFIKIVYYSLGQLSLPGKRPKSLMSPAKKLGEAPPLCPNQVIWNPEQMQSQNNSLSWKRDGRVRESGHSVSFCFGLWTWASHAWSLVLSPIIL